MFPTRKPVRPRVYVVVYAALAALLILAHGPLLRLPYFWDEAGQFVPAAMDIYHSGALVPHSTLPNVHPPAVMAWVALAWHVFGFSIPAARIAMLLIAGAGALFTFLLAIELSRRSPGTPAFFALAFLCLSPLFFAQAMLVQLDMPAMCFTVMALLLFLQNHFRASALTCVALVMVKETGIVLPAVLGGWLVYERRYRDAVWFALPLAPLIAWLLLLHQKTGHWLGNSAFTQYNLFYPLNPVRFTLALLRRLYYLFIGTGHFIGTAAFIWAWKRMPMLRERAWRICAAFATAHTLAVTAFGGAVLERYLLPVLPILFIAFAVSLQSLLPRRRTLALTGLLVSFFAANLINPPYPFPFENNLEFVSFVGMQMDAADRVAAYQTKVVTAFPMTAALRNPDYGYIAMSKKVREIPDFTEATIATLHADPPDVLIAFDTAADPLGVQKTAMAKWFLRKFYAGNRTMTGDEIAADLGMVILERWEHRGTSMQLLVRVRKTL